VNSDLGIFFCDLDSKQRDQARDWSLNKKGILQAAQERLEEAARKRSKDGGSSAAGVNAGSGQSDLTSEAPALVKPASIPVKDIEAVVISAALSLIEPGANIKLQVESDLPQSSIDPLTEDLIACACHIYQADRMMLRPPENWRRRMEFHIGVKSIGAYEPVADKISKIIGDLCNDQVTIQFYPLQGVRQTLSLPKPAVNPNGGVCVFSDNLDSMAGVATVNKETDILASFQYGPEKPRTNQVRLIKKIEAVTFSNLDYIGLKIMPKGIKGRDITQRSRGFLQLSLAGAIARHSGLRRIQVFGNGFSSYHLRRRQICGPGFAVRDTYPIFLRQMLDLFTALKVAEGLEVTNPFQFSTPSEVLKILIQLLPQGARDLFRYTDSCLEHEMAKGLRRWNPRSLPHCGCCFPCKIRRLAALVMDFEQRHNYKAYSVDPMSVDVSSRSTNKLGRSLNARLQQFHVNGLSNLKDYLNIFTNTATQIMQFPEIGEHIRSLSAEALDFTPTKRDSDAVRNSIIKLHQQFASEALKYFKKAAIKSKKLKARSKKSASKSQKPKAAPGPQKKLRTR
jgi:hypothetical protein